MDIIPNELRELANKLERTKYEESKKLEKIGTDLLFISTCILQLARLGEDEYSKNLKKTRRKHEAQNLVGAVNGSNITP
jgi:hypothetical protein